MLSLVGSAAGGRGRHHSYRAMIACPSPLPPTLKAHGHNPTTSSCSLHTQAWLRDGTARFNCSGSASRSRPRPWGVWPRPPRAPERGENGSRGTWGGVCPAGRQVLDTQEPHTSTQSCPRWGTGTASEDTRGRHGPPGSRGCTRCPRPHRTARLAHELLTGPRQLSVLKATMTRKGRGKGCPRPLAGSPARGTSPATQPTVGDAGPGPSPVRRPWSRAPSAALHVAWGPTQSRLGGRQQQPHRHPRPGPMAETQGL